MTVIPMGKSAVNHINKSLLKHLRSENCGGRQGHLKGDVRWQEKRPTPIQEGENKKGNWVLNFRGENKKPEGVQVRTGVGP